MTSKHQRLQALGARLPVPPLLTLSETELSRLWTNLDDLREQARATVQRIRNTASAFLDEHLDELRQVLRPRWHGDADARLLAAFASAGLSPTEALAVRSSAEGEDAPHHSFAGVFLTRLDVRGMAELRRAIEDVWTSGFGGPAIMERLRAGSLEQGLGMTVIVQRMVRAQWAGVAFSHDPLSGEEVCTLEAVPGLGESLVSGASRGLRARVRAGRPELIELGGPTEVFLQAATLTAQVVDAMQGTPMDIEWAFDGEQVWLLQARPITTLRVMSRQHEDPTLEVVPLYAAADEDIASLRPLPDFAHYFRSKRKPLADFARHMGLPAPTALLVRANAAGLVRWGQARIVDACAQDRVVLDVSAQVRQLGVPRGQALARLQELLQATPGVFVVRDFIQGRAGLITQPAPAGDEVLCEWSPDGLLAINRGTGTAQQVLIAADGSHAAAATDTPFSVAHGSTLHRVTLAAQAVFGQVQLEWVLNGDDLYLLDYSVLDSLGWACGEAGTRVISAGQASGRSLVVHATRDIEQLSIAACVSLTDVPRPQDVGGAIARLHQAMQAQGAPVVIVANRPYAALAPLVPFAAGFVFERAATLCHLAILLREHGVPAIESDLLYQDALQAPGRHLSFNASTEQPLTSPT